MKELLPENEDELNQLAKKALKSVKADVEPNMLYCLQLAKWSLESGKVEILNDQLGENLDALLYLWEPKNAMEFLLGEHDLLKDLPKNWKPLDLAVAVLNQLDSRLTEYLEGYPRPRDLPANFR